MANQWTTEYPTQPGYYWLRNYRFDCHGDIFSRPGPELFDFRNGYSEIYRLECGTRWERAEFKSGEWFGPILPPPDTCPKCGRQAIPGYELICCCSPEAIQRITDNHQLPLHIVLKPPEDKPKSRYSPEYIQQLEHDLIDDELAEQSEEPQEPM